MLWLDLLWRSFTCIDSRKLFYLVLIKVCGYLSFMSISKIFSLSLFSCKRFYIVGCNEIKLCFFFFLCNLFTDKTKKRLSNKVFQRSLVFSSTLLTNSCSTLFVKLWEEWLESAFVLCGPFRYLEQRVQKKKTKTENWKKLSEIFIKRVSKKQILIVFTRKIFRRETNTATSVCPLRASLPLCTNTLLFSMKAVFSCNFLTVLNVFKNSTQWMLKVKKTLKLE